MAKLTVLIEDSTDSRLVSEHGLSFLVETTRLKFLFDCGQTGAAWSNAKTLRVALEEIKFVALSHSHYDHAGGFPKLLNFAPIKTVFTGKNFWQEKFSRDCDGFKYRGCGFDKNFLANRGIEQKICRNVIEIDDNAWIVGNFKQRYDFETIPTKFVRGIKKIPDDFSDEIVLTLRGKNGLAIVTACAHSGILNIVSDIRERFSMPIVEIIGGLHLIGASDEKISRTIDELNVLGVKKILPCHCSGKILQNKVQDRILTGSVIIFD